MRSRKYIKKMSTISVFFLISLQFMMPNVKAMTYFHDGGVHNLHYPLDGIAVLDNFEGVPTTVNLISGGKTIDFWVYGNSYGKLNGGTVQYFEVYENGNIEIQNGEIESFLTMRNDSRGSILGGKIGYDLHTRGNSQLTIFGGQIKRYLEAEDRSRITISGGTIGDFVKVVGTSEVIIEGGILQNGAIINYDGYLCMSGGVITGKLLGATDSVIEIRGNNLNVDGLSVDYGSFSNTGEHFSDEHGKYYTDYIIAGELLNGDIINNVVEVYDNSKLIVIPEPTTILMLVMGFVVLRTKK